MLDTSWNFYPLTILKKIINSMMLSKLNVFHWHIVDDDSWPMEFKAYPDLTKLSAFSEKEVYSLKDILSLSTYAYKRGIYVVPEIEGPAHLNSLGHLPELTELIGCFVSHEK